MKNLTPGEIAKYCGVHQRTVSRWITQGHLRGFQLPGRGNYRVEVSEFVNFLKNQGFPVPAELLSTPSILIVDDDPLVLKSLELMLSAEGYHVITAEDGFKAAVVLLTAHPKLMLLDLEMPGLDGMGVLEMMAETPELQKIKTIVISASIEAHREELEGMGLAGLHGKPYNKERLLKAIQKVL